MADVSVMRRLRYAKRTAKEDLLGSGHTIINSDNEIICITATFGNFIERKIKIVVDEILETDIDMIKRLNITPYQTKEIWCKKENKKGFECLIFDKDNNRIQPFYLCQV